MVDTLSKEQSGQLALDFFFRNEDLLTVADITCIKQTLKELFEEQQEDVLKAEKRFKTHKGILFTNGTGTGKTFTGLGIAKRFTLQDKRNILIVVPTDTKAKDWVKAAGLLDIYATQLKDIKDAKKGVTVTTYANFYQNEKILKIDYDLVIYDESHYLMQNAQGEFTEALYKHKKVAKLPSSFRDKYYLSIENSCYKYDKSCDRNYIDRDLFKQRYEAKLNEYLEKTKVVFLSATPFAYHKSLLIGDGTLWEIDEVAKFPEYSSSGYNEGSAYESFFMQNFGYRMRYNKLTVPETGVNQSLLERNFFEKYKELGAISGRQIDIDADYSREFVVVNSDIGQKIDEGKSLMYSKEFSDKYPYLSRFSGKKFSFNYTNQLLECIKAKDSIDRIEKHLKLGRKVVIFHNYNNSLPEHPFKFNARKLLTKKEDREKYFYLLEEEIENFEIEYPEYVNLNLDDLVNTRDTIKRHFDNVHEFNGTITSKKKRQRNIDEFNDPNSDIDILLVQRKAGKEGISLHDIFGDRPRVLMNLGLPTAPTDAIQIEGRIYRLGLIGNAMLEYVTLQTNFEQIAFAEKVATRSRTAENLALGNLARDLETVFIEGYLNPTYEDPNLEQGVGGKENDRNFNVISEYDKAKTYYYAQVSKNAKNRSKEGLDYYSTPEPIGYIIKKWMNVQPNDSVLEPSAGHGALARFYDSQSNNVFIEPSYELYSRLKINCKGNVIHDRFENYNIINKFNKIVMNPPYGKSSKLAMEHLEKALKHLRFWGDNCLFAIVPNGPSFQKRLDNYLSLKDNEEVKFTHEIILPSVTFKRAGTMVYTKIIRLTKNSEENVYTQKIDLTHIDCIEKLFDEIEHLEIA